MGNFLLVIADEYSSLKAKSLFDRSLQLASRLKGQTEMPNILQHPNLWIALFPRQNGTGGTIAVNEETNDWLLSIGTWIYSDIVGLEREQRLLSFIRDKGVAHAARNLEGFFVIAGGNPGKEIYVITDIVGSCHAFSRSWNGITVISGSSLLLAALDEYSLDPIACQEFVQGGVIYEDRTLFREVRKLQPATHYCYEKGRLSKQDCYWAIKNLKPESLDGAKAVDALKSSIQTAARKIGSLASKPLCDLTGGFDSRALVAGFLSVGIPVATAVSGPAESSDVRVSSALAHLASLSHTHSDPEPVRSYEQIRKALQLTDGEYDIVEYARVREIHQKHAEAFDVSLNGSFGEVARGYWWEILVPHVGKQAKLDSRKVARLRYLLRGINPTLFPADQRMNLEDHYAGIIGRSISGIENTPNTFQLDNTYLRLRMQRWQGRIASSTNQIWPCLSPFMFRSILEVMLQTDHNLRRRSLLIRKLLPELDTRFAQYPLEFGFPPLPVSFKTMHRFWPIVSLYGKKAIRRLKLGKPVVTSTGPTSSRGRLQLWQDPQIAELLRAHRMLSTKVLDGYALGNFLKLSQQQEFPYEGQWARVLTLECALRRIEDARH